jgi:hypothetical protein
MKHYTPNPKTYVSKCGYWTGVNERTNDVSRVNCKNCKRTKAYQKALLEYREKHGKITHLENVAVHLPTQEKWNNFLNALDPAVYGWCGNIKPNDYNQTGDVDWRCYRKNTFIFIKKSKKYMLFGTKKFIGTLEEMSYEEAMLSKPNIDHCIKQTKSELDYTINTDKGTVYTWGDCNQKELPEMTDAVFFEPDCPVEAVKVQYHPYRLSMDTGG